MSNGDKEFWNKFYESKAASDKPSPFAEFCEKEFFKPKSFILELGPGNGRDSFYFASCNLRVHGIDQSNVAIENNTSRAQELFSDERLTFECGDFVEAIAQRESHYDFVYSRFTLHSINEEAQWKLFDNVRKVLSPKGRFLIEVRTTKDPLFGQGEKVSPFEFRTDHYRRFIDTQSFIPEIIRRGWKVEYFEERNNLAPYQGEDPIVSRFSLMI